MFTCQAESLQGLVPISSDLTVNSASKASVWCYVYVYRTVLSYFMVCEVFWGCKDPQIESTSRLLHYIRYVRLIDPSP